MAENALKVQKKLNELNSREPGLLLSAVSATWTAVPGYFAVTGFDYGQGSPTFNANFGYPIKIFVNQRTGEMKFYPASLFEN
jgi:hypothetical protein